ncbi:MAG: enoyl-CoA hydratase/isomerase family protein [Phycisphaerales bacterium]|nr:enoyl-CoA hydratase/isomerase family protein [Phycisphaerales bacterium]
MIRGVEHEGGVGVLTLCRPDKRNALTPGMLWEFSAQAQRLAQTCRCVLVEGEGPMFCAGFDLAAAAADPTGAELASMLRALATAIDTLDRIDVPVVASVVGGAIAGGCALLGGCDWVYSHAGAKFGYPVPRLGLSPGVSAPSLRTRLAGGGVRELMLGVGVCSVEDAYRQGLVHDVAASAAECRARAIARAEDVARKPAWGVQATRRLCRELERRPEHGERGLEISLGSCGTDEQRGMLGAFWRTR